MTIVPAERTGPVTQTSGSVTTYTPKGGGRATYETYNTATTGGGGVGGSYRGPIASPLNAARRIPAKPAQAQTPPGVPAFFGQRPILFYTWLAAIGLICWDEWNLYHILPRPARLWGATWVWVGLSALSIPDPLVPLANALGIGYMVTLGYQYFNKQGQFSADPGKFTQGGSGG